MLAKNQVEPDPITMIFQFIHCGLVEDLEANGLTTLLDFVVKAGLAEALTEPLTLFAPSNEAFEKLSPETVEALTNNPDLLKNTLLYHVILGANIPSSALKEDNVVETAANGAKLRVNGYVTDFKTRTIYKVVTANGKKVVIPDVPAGSESIVHVVDEVIPYLDPVDNIPAALTKAGRFSTLLTAVGEAGLAEALSAEGEELFYYLFHLKRSDCAHLCIFQMELSLSLLPMMMPLPRCHLMF